MTLESYLPTRRRLLWAALALAVLATMLAWAQGFRSTEAAPGDPVATITADRTGTDCVSTGSGSGGVYPEAHSSVGVGIAFDGVNLLISCYSDNSITEIDPTDGSQVAVHFIGGASSLGALSWAGASSTLWACSAFADVGTVDLSTDTFTFAFNTGAVGGSGCFDGLAYDGTDDTIWASGDVSPTTEHYTTAGALIDSFPNVALLGGTGNSGIVVGGSVLYLANNGASQIWTVEKDFTSSVLFSTFDRRLEDLECDPVTFSSLGLGAIWSIDAYDNILNAWEIPADQCEFGGGGGDKVEVTKHWSQTNVCFEADNDGDGQASEDPLNWDAAGAPIDDDGDGLFNEDPSECGGAPSLGTPLATDEDGDYQIQAVIKKNGTVSSYNPGQAYAVSTVEVLSDIDGLIITENYSDCTSGTPPLLTLNPKAGGGGGSVVVVIVDADGDPVQVLDATSPEVAETDTEAVVTLGPQAEGTIIMVYVKFAPGQKGSTFAEDSCENINSAQALDEEGEPDGDQVDATAVLELTAKP